MATYFICTFRYIYTCEVLWNFFFYVSATIIFSFPSNDGAGQQCCYDKNGYLMMTSDNKWGGKPMRSHNLGVLPWNEANKIPTLSHYLGDTLPFYLCCMWQGEQSNGCQNYRYERRSSQDCVGYQPPGGGKSQLLPKVIPNLYYFGDLPENFWFIAD